MDLGEFFSDLDNNLHGLRIKSYSVSMPTLEDVFLNVASEDSKQLEKERRQFSENDQIMIKYYSKQILMKIIVINRNFVMTLWLLLKEEFF